MVKLSNNKAGYTAIQSRTVGQGLYCENRSQLKNVRDRPTDRPTRQVLESRVRDLKKGEKREQLVIQGSHMVSGTRCPAWSDKLQKWSESSAAAHVL